MLDTKKVGIKIATLRKSIGLPQEKLAEMLNISPAENMFFTIKLINNGIFDFNMRDKAIKAFETFVIEDK